MQSQYCAKIVAMKHAKGRFSVAVTALLIVGEVLLAGGGVVVFAQTASDTVDVVTVDATPALPVPVVSTTTDVNAGTDLQGASSTPQLQDTFSDQETVPPDASSTVEIILATTTDPVPPIIEEATTTPEEVPPPDATTTDPVPPVEPEVVPPEEMPPPQIIPQEQAPVIISAEELKPEAKYVFSLSGKLLRTSKRVRHVTMVKSKPVVTELNEEVSVLPTISTDNVNGVMTVSGVCDNKYYVILVYKSPEDYARDPRTYIVNRSFPCENGNYSYAIADLPPSLSDGNYYLLVASMGDVGQWTPITGITEVTLTGRN